MSSEADSYQLVRCLRSTETSETYEATHPTVPGRFLVELFAPGQDTAAMGSFEAELASLAELGHPNIMTVIGLGKLPDGKTAAIWELAGGTLAEWLHRGRSASAEAALGVLSGIAQALGAAHARGIAHEKVGPEHVFLIEDADLAQGGVKLGGFGLRWLQPGGPGAGSGPDRRIAPDLAGLADIAERLLAPLDLPMERPLRSRGAIPTASQVITRGRGHGAGAPFGTAVEFAEALAVAVRAQVDEASSDGFEPVARPSNEERTDRTERNDDGPGEGRYRRRLALVVARVGAATLGTVLTVLVVGVLVDPKNVPIPPANPPVQAPVAQSVHAIPPAPPAAPVPPPAAAVEKPVVAEVPAPAKPAPAQPVVAEKPSPPPVAAPAEKPASPRVVDIGPPERARQPQRARRGLVWSSRLQKLVTVEEAAAAAAP